MCSKFMRADTLAYRYLDGNRDNQGEENLRWITAVQAFEAAMLKGDVWTTDLSLSEEQRSQLPAEAASMKETLPDSG